jgi:hypothetical protein
MAETRGARDAASLGFVNRLEIEAIQPSELGRSPPCEF